MSSIPQSRSPVPPSVCLPLSLPPCSSSILCPLPLSPGLCPLFLGHSVPSIILSILFPPDFCPPSLSLFLVPVSVSLSPLFFCPFSSVPYLPHPLVSLSPVFLSLVSLALSVTCLLPPSLSHYLYPCLSAVPPLSTLTASIPGSPIPILPSSLSLSLCAPGGEFSQAGHSKEPRGETSVHVCREVRMGDLGM